MSTPDNREAAFIAKITASTTHELRNVLAIMKESAGLIEDMLLAVDLRGSRNRTYSSARSVESSLRSTVEPRSWRTSTGSHIASTKPSTDDLNQDVEQIAFLGQSFARQKNHLLKVLPGGDAPKVSLNSLRLQMAVFAAIRCCMERLPEPGTITLRTVGQGGRSLHRVHCRGAERASLACSDSVRGMRRTDGDSRQSGRFVGND